MPFTKTYQVPEQFFKVFTGDAQKKFIPGDSRKEYPMLPIVMNNGEVRDYLVKYFKRSGQNGTEEVMEYYPCIVIQDFHPEIDRSQLWGKDYEEGFIDAVSGTREIIFMPVPMKYRFQVSVVSKRLKESQSSADWFLNKFNFRAPDYFMFNKIDTEEGPVGDVVSYTCNWMDIPREDGRFEVAYDFTLNTYIHANSKTYSVDPVTGEVTGGDFRAMVEKIKISLQLKDFATFEKILQHNFEISK